MTLPASGYLGLAEIHSEFGRGFHLGGYRGTPYYVGTTPLVFPAAPNPISIGHFFSAQAATQSSMAGLTPSTTAINCTSCPRPCRMSTYGR